MTWAQDLRSFGMKPSGPVDLEGSSEEMVEYTSCSEITISFNTIDGTRENQLDEGFHTSGKH